MRPDSLHPKRRDRGQSWRRLPPRAGDWGLPGATEEGDGADPTGAGRGHRSPHGLIVEGREELLYLLGEAAELEHSIFCAYLYAAFTLQGEPGAGLTAAQVPTVAGWKRAIKQISLQEMIHLALANNLLAALGVVPPRHNNGLR